MNLIDPLGLRPSDSDFDVDVPGPSADCTWADAVGDAFIYPGHDPGTPADPRCRTVADEYIDAVVLVPETWDAPHDGYQRCATTSWTISVRVVGKNHGGQRFGVLMVEPSGLARWSAYPARAAGGDRPWRHAWQCAQEAMAEVIEPLVYGTEGAYRSQYYCHAFGSINVGFGWFGGTHWDLEGWRPETWNKQTWIGKRCNW